MRINKTIGIIIALCLIILPSCDLIIQPRIQEFDPDDLFAAVVFDVINPGYWHWRDEVRVYNNGKTTIQRRMGDEIPASSRSLSGEELTYLKSLFRDFGTLETSYLDDTYKEYSTYAITYYGDGKPKTVDCDNSVYDYRIAGSRQYEILRPIVSALSDIRIALLGEEKFAGKLEFNFRSEKSVVDLDEEIVLLYEVRNTSRQDVILPFANLQQLGYKVYYNGNLIVGYPMAFLPATSAWNIPAGSTREQKISWPQTIHNDGYEFSDKRAKSGVYTIVQYLLDGNSPYRATDIMITENGDIPLQARAIKSIMRPQELIYELNNRVSEEIVFTFSINKPIGYKIISLDSGKVIRADSTETPGSSRIAIEPYGDYIYSIPWNGRDSAGDFLKNGKYMLEMWMIGQDPDYRAFREFWIYYI
jgi:hypothetical protein